MLEISGVQKTTMIDYPGKLAATVFLPKCNFRCGFCHNPELVFNTVGERIPEEEVLDFLESKKKWLDAVCVTGGEPTLHKELPDFFEKTKKMGYLNKLDTNGSNPRMIKELLEKNVVDYLAMDIKATLGKYEKACGAKPDTGAITRSAELAKKFPEYEFRTTVLPALHSKEDLVEIGKWLKGSKRYSMQRFNDENAIIDKSLVGTGKYSRTELEEIRKSLLPYFEEIEVK